MNPGGAMALHDALADAVGPRILCCAKCGDWFEPNAGMMAIYFRCGWPRCCGLTMTLRPNPKSER